MKTMIVFAIHLHTCVRVLLLGEKPEGGDLCEGATPDEDDEGDLGPVRRIVVAAAVVIPPPQARLGWALSLDGQKGGNRTVPLFS